MRYLKSAEGSVVFSAEPEPVSLTEQTQPVAALARLRQVVLEAEFPVPREAGKRHPFFGHGQETGEGEYHHAESSGASRSRLNGVLWLATVKAKYVPAKASRKSRIPHRILTLITLRPARRQVPRRAFAH
jgi:hypothetical protein